MKKFLKINIGKENTIKELRNIIFLLSFFSVFPLILLVGKYENTSYAYIMFDVFLGFAVNILATLILFYLLERRKEKEKEEQQNIVIERLLFPIKEFNEFILHLYKATIKEGGIVNGTINMYENINELYNQINTIDLLSPSYPTNNQEFGIYNVIENIDLIDCSLIKIEEYIVRLQKIMDRYIFVLSDNNQILTRIERIANENPVPGIRAMISSTNNEGKIFCNEIIEDSSTGNIKQKMLFLVLSLFEKIKETKELMEYIDIHTSKENFIITEKYFNNLRMK